MIKVSVIVPVYNTEKYLKRCLDSLVNQTLKEIEIIVINDNSPDDSKKILKDYETKYNNIKVIHNKTNKGIGYNRNLGIKEAKGKYISFIDSDDYIDANMYEIMYNKAVKDKNDLVICNYHKMLEKEKGNTIEIESDYEFEKIDDTTLKDNPNLIWDINMAPWNKLYSKDLIKNISFPENLKYEDAIVTIKCLSKAKNIGFCTEKLNYYLVRNISETGNMDKKVYDILTITDMIVNTLKETDYYKDVYEYLEAFVIRNLFRYTLQQKNQKDWTIANDFINKAFEYLDDNFPNWKKNKIWNKRNIIKKTIEKNKFLTKLYCRL